MEIFLPNIKSWNARFLPGKLINGRRSLVQSWTSLFLTGFFCASVFFSPSAKAQAVEHILWLGKVNNNWNEPANWSLSSIPTSNSNIVIQSSALFSPVINSGNVIVNNLELQSGKTLNISGASFTMNGVFSGTGTFSTSSTTSLTIGGDKGGSAGTLRFTPERNIVGSFKLNRTGDGSLVYLSSPLIISNVFTATSGVFNTLDNLILHSDENGTASVGPSEGVIAGKVTVERYMPARRVWRLMCASVSPDSAPTINASYQEEATTSTANYNAGYGTHITGGSAASGFDQSPNNFPSIKYFFNNGWKGLGNTNTTAITKYPGYFFFVRGNRSYDILNTTQAVDPSATTLRVKGNLNQGTQPFIRVATEGITLVSNPFASPISFSSVVASGTNIKNRLYVWDPALGGTEGVGGNVILDWNGSSYTAVPSSSMSSVIQAGQAFFVETENNLSTGKLIIKEAHKASATSFLPFGRVSSLDAALMINLKIFNQDKTPAVADGVMARFSREYDNGVNSDDAVKINNFIENLAIVSNAKLLTIERRTIPSIADTLVLNISGLTATTYQLEFIKKDFETIGVEPSLYDRYTKTLYPLTFSSDTSRYTFTVTGDASSYQAKRLNIVYRNSSVLPVTIASVKAKVIGSSSVNIEWEVVYEQNILQYQVEKFNTSPIFRSIGIVQATTGGTSKATYNFSDENAQSGDNIYRIKSIGLDGKISYSAAVSVNIKKQGPLVTVYPNPVQGRAVHLNLNNVRKGNYQVNIINQQGQMVDQSALNYQGNSSQTIYLNHSVPAGIYFLFIRQGSESFKTTLLLK